MRPQPYGCRHNGSDDRGRDGRQLFSHEIASRTKYDDKRPEAWLETTINYLVDRAHGMEPLLEWVVKRQLQEIELQDVHKADAGMHDPIALSLSQPLGLPQPSGRRHLGCS